MAAPDWVSYVSAATGLAGDVMGYIAYRRVGAMKALDLRLELRKAEAGLLAAFRPLHDLRSTAHRSRTRVSAMRGLLESGQMVVFERQWNEDLAAATALTDQMPSANNAHAGVTHEQLEHALVEVHRLAGAVKTLVDRCRTSIAEDDVHRAERRGDLRPDRM